MEMDIILKNVKIKKLNNFSINKYAKSLCDCKTLIDLARILNTTKNTLILHAVNPTYFHFTIPKKNGKLRYIEAPNNELKKIQRNLNVFFQCYYYLNQSEAAYGYIIKPKNEVKIKNIKTNAEAHLGYPYLLNADFEDFFHQITEKHIFNLFLKSPFNFSKKLANVIAKLCTYNGRLPMGAPTSPSLSNIYCTPF